MSDIEIEDVSFLPGESLHRKAVYEPNICQRLGRLVGLPITKEKIPLLVVILGIFILLIVVLAVFARPRCPGSSVATTTPPPVEKKPDYISTNGEKFPWQDIRLPKTVVPLHYKLFLHPNISQSVFSGKVEILCAISKSTDFIVFHIKDLNITKLSVQSSSGTQLLKDSYLEYKENEQVYAKLGDSVDQGVNVTVKVEFKGQLTERLAGFYRSGYTTSSGEKRYLATTHFEPTDARAAFPCFDEPALKATFELSMVRDPDYISLFNMPLLDTEDYGTGLKVDHFTPSVKMSTYLVAFVVCDYKNISDTTKSNVKVSVYAPAEQLYQVQFALEVAVKVLDSYDDFFGIKYPLPKQDLIAIPDFAAGAMENWGLITYRMTSIMYDPQVTPAHDQQWVAITVAHELAHQWFGNLVTMDWWDDLWLNEGFASLVEFMGVATVEPTWKMNEQFVTQQLSTALYRDSLTTSHPIMLPVKDPKEINEIFDTISYSKGSSIIRMLRNHIGANAFQAGLSAYLHKYQYSNAVTKDLWDSLSGALTDGTDLNALMDTWTKQMGYPVVTLTRKGNQVTACQERFLLYPNSSIPEEFTSPYGYVWHVPFSYSTKSEPTNPQRVLLKDKCASYSVTGSPEWVKGNVGVYGYYRVNYDLDNWRALIKQLHVDHTVFTPAERAGLIDDVFQLSRAGLLPSHENISLDLSLYMVNEEDYLPWIAFLPNVGYLRARLQNTPAYRTYKMYLRKLLNKMLTTTTWGHEESHLKTFLQSTVIHEGVLLGHEASVTKGKQLFEQWQSNHSSITNPNVKSSVFRAGVMYGEDQEWEACWEAYLKEEVPSEKRLLLRALGFTKDARLLSRLLGYSLDKEVVRSQDTSSLVGAVSAAPGGQDLAWKFFQRNWEAFRDRYSGTSFTMSGLISSVAAGFDSQFDHDQVKAFFSTRDAGSGKRAVKQALEKMQMNTDWRKEHEQHVTAWLEDHGKGSL